MEIANANLEFYFDMSSCRRYTHEGIVEYAERLAAKYATSHMAKDRKAKGQVFTPQQVSRFMANMFDVSKSVIRLLDPGAGTGVLTAAFCEGLLDSDAKIDLTIDAYENDPNIIPFLKTVLDECKAVLEASGHKVTYNICEQDFIMHNRGHFAEQDLFNKAEPKTLYDFSISNPPYYKLNKNSPQSLAMMKIVSGQPNIYKFFMALSVSMLNQSGQMVFITPRSFCSGLYFRKFRQWFLDKAYISRIHIFESRKGVFDKDEILQENVIIKAEKSDKTPDNEQVTVSVSEDKRFTFFDEMQVAPTDVIYHRNGDIFIRIPTSQLDLEVIHIVDNWPNTIRDIGLEISTGPVVDFRATQFLLPELTTAPESVPLLWMHNLRDTKVVWPLRKNNKASAFRNCEESAPILLPVRNYVLLKRFTSKEQKRRLYSAVFLESDFPYKAIGIENHVNYIHKPDGALSVTEAYGIAVLLNSRIVDLYFRSLNGNTQVNATDIRSIPFPNMDDIRRIGETAYENQSLQNGTDLDSMIAPILGIDPEIVAKLGGD